MIELHTGRYADCAAAEQAQELRKLSAAATYATRAGVHVNAGHGLNYDNVQAIARLPEIRELNIGHSIVAQAVFVGIDRAVRDMKALINPAP